MPPRAGRFKSVPNRSVGDDDLGRPAQEYDTGGRLQPKTLPKGEACIECRRKKKRCDGVRPICDRCAKSRLPVKCIYELASVPVRGGTTGPSLFHFAPPHTPSGMPKGLFLDAKEFFDPLSPDIPAVPREKAVVRFRVATLSHQYKLGILVNCAKEQAIILGDLSGTFVHPVYINFAQLYGCRAYRLIFSDWSMFGLEIELDKELETALSEMGPTDEFNWAQVHFIVGVHLVFSQATTATRYIQLAANMIEHSPHVFLPSLVNAPQTLTPLEPSEEVQQRFALIAHIVNCRSLLRIHMLEKATKTVLTARDVLGHLPDPVAQEVLISLEGPSNGTLRSLDRFFGVGFWEEKKSWIASNPLTIGATTMLFALEARLLTALENKNTGTTLDRCESAESFVRTLSLHLKRIDETLLRYIDLGDLGGSVSIQSSKLIALVALAEICYDLSLWVDPGFRKAEVQRLFLVAMESVVAIVDDLQDGNHLQRVHVYTGFSIGLAINTCTKQMVSRHNISPPQIQSYPHQCDLQDCLGTYIPPLTDAYETLSMTPV